MGPTQLAFLVWTFPGIVRSFLELHVLPVPPSPFQQCNLWPTGRTNPSSVAMMRMPSRHSHLPFPSPKGLAIPPMQLSRPILFRVNLRTPPGSCGKCRISGPTLDLLKPILLFNAIPGIYKHFKVLGGGLLGQFLWDSNIFPNYPQPQVNIFHSAPLVPYLDFFPKKEVLDAVLISFALL